MPVSKEKAKARRAVNKGWENLKKGKCFKPGKSGNPGGRPTKFISIVSDAIRECLKEVNKESQLTYAQLLAKRIVEEGCFGKLPIPAIHEIIDRTEGKPKQQIDVNDVTDKFSGRTKEELAYFAQHGKFPDVQG